jgi:hypothetical protein
MLITAKRRIIPSIHEYLSYIDTNHFGSQLQGQDFTQQSIQADISTLKIKYGLDCVYKGN